MNEHLLSRDLTLKLTYLPRTMLETLSNFSAVSVSDSESGRYVHTCVQTNEQIQLVKIVRKLVWCHRSMSRNKNWSLHSDIQQVQKSSYRTQPCVPSQMSVKTNSSYSAPSRICDRTFACVSRKKSFKFICLLFLIHSMPSILSVLPTTFVQINPHSGPLLYH